MDSRDDYYLLNLDELQEELNFSLKEGLHPREVSRRQAVYGVNQLVEGEKRGFLGILLQQFNDFMILVLMGATLLSFIMGELGDAITISAIIILNGLLGFIQEFRAERSLAALKKLTAPSARVIRDGKIEDLPAQDLVPGDLILVEAGDRVPADARIIESQNLMADESLLTGESVPVAKSEEKLYARKLDLSQQRNMLFTGTNISRGKGRAVVVATGMNTQMGKIAHLLKQKTAAQTPLQKRLKHLGKWLVIVSVAITFLIVIMGILKGQSIYQMFLAGVSLAVAAIPEGLPAIVTLSLALGVQKMIKENAIVRKLQSVETLGCATVICSDKTGTLTKNQMTLSKIYLNHKISNFSPDLSFSQLKKLLFIGAICNSVKLKEAENQGTLEKVKRFFVGQKVPEFLGDPTEVALVRAIYTFQLRISELKEEYPVLAEEAFDSKRKRMSVLVQTPEKEKELWIKGAPEVILDLSKSIEINGQVYPLTPELREEVSKAAAVMAQDALRVLAVAYRPIQGRIKSQNLKGYERNLILVGLVGLIDPPREEAYGAVQDCYRAGIKPVMITGDHRITAKVIAEDLGIISRRDRVLSGEELKAVDDRRLKEVIQKVQVYARVSPEDKLRIVRALKENGEIVAMTGDGVNDAPAVKEADIGIAMGKKGTDVTKEVSALILADDNFATIVKAIEEGRKIYNNIRKFIRYLLSCNTGEILSIFMGIALGLPLPLLPIQILWVNLVTDGLPALALGMDDDGEDVMNKPPRDPKESIFAHGMVSRIISQGSLIGISTMLAFLIAIYRLGTDLSTARTMAFSTLVFSQLFFVFSCRSEDLSFWQLSPLSNLYLLGAVFLSVVMQFAVIYVPYLQPFFQTSTLDQGQWLVVIVLSTWSTILLDLIKYFLQRIR